jgi:riboflavin synthase
MFTGIIEGLGKISTVSETGTNRSFVLSSPFTQELRVDQSLSHNGICLTIESVTGNLYQVTAVEETLTKTSAGQWKAGDMINLERAMVMNGRLDGHLVQGHVDATATVINITDMGGSREYDFQFPTHFATMIIEKGSVCINGVSLTAFNVTANSFRVAIIPYTYEHTSFPFLQAGDTVNIEFDMIGKYVNRFISLQNIQS